MKRQRYILIAIWAAFSVAVTTGCGKSHPAPPLEQGELVLRFFNSMGNGLPDTALRQGEKLETFYPDNDFLDRLIAIQQSNSYILKSRQQLEKKNVPEAVRAIDRGLKLHSGNRILQNAKLQLRQLQHAGRYFKAIRDARSATALDSALTAAQFGLSANLTPKVRRYFEACRKEVQVRREREKKEAVTPQTIPDVRFDD